MDMLNLRSVIVMVTPVTIEDKFQEFGDLIYAGEYLDIAGTPNGNYTMRLRVRRLICRVCKLKFRTHQETQDHIRREASRKRENLVSQTIGRNIGDIMISEKIGK